MAQPDWYRSKTWTGADRAAFYARLKRSRGAEGKAQYLRIQAVHLAEAGNHTAALDLLTELLREYPDSFEVALGLHQQGESLLAVGRRDEAFDAYRRSMQAQRARPNVKTGCHLDFAWEIAIGGVSDLYDEAIAVLDEFADRTGLVLEDSVYREAVARALIAEARGDYTTARENAGIALNAAEVEHSGLRYHPEVGLANADPAIQRRLAAIASR